MEVEMGDFFKGWRRKAGCVVFVFACVAASGWIRSLSYCDSVQIPISRHARLNFGSALGVVGLSYETFGVNSSTENSFEFWSNPEPVSIDEALLLEGFMPSLRESDALKWRFRYAGFLFGQAQAAMSFAAVPFWSIALPLTLLSAYLLLWPQYLPLKNDSVLNGSRHRRFNSPPSLPGRKQ
jgi:hypothetical protein